ncbi:MAG: biotin synthase BioB [Bacteroides sp.]|nr:biotin synthase BioB [Bacteroides sp.]
MSGSMSIDALAERILAGGELTDSEVYALADADSRELREAAARVTAALAPRQFDSCSIINARSGACSEDCKWCAQSGHYHTGCATRGVVDRAECLRQARLNKEGGVRRFSLVTSGRAARGAELEELASICADIRDKVGIYTCASMGLLDRDGLQQLWDAGVRRYHCNLETAPSHFATLCTTHTIDDKLATIAAAHEIGFDVCSGGIIGMGESRRQRAEFAVTLRRARPVSIPINILQPIPGTPLADAAPITDDEIIDAVAIMRLAHPRTAIRFAGGRARLGRDTQLELMRVGVNGGIVGDLLTTLGSTLEQDKDMVRDAGYDF